jgi:hypothetical protein
MKPAGKGALYELDDAPPMGFGMLIDASDVDALEGSEHGGGHGSADKLPDADFFNGAFASADVRRQALGWQQARIKARLALAKRTLGHAR